MNGKKLIALFKNYDSRALLFTATSLFLNAIFIVFYAVLCIANNTIYYVPMLEYFLIYAIARAVILIYSLKAKSAGRKPTYISQCNTLQTVGILMFLLSLILVDENLIRIHDSQTKYIDAVFYVNIIYVYIKLIVGVYNVIKNFKKVSSQENPLITATKCLSHCETLASVIFLKNAVIMKLDISDSVGTVISVTLNILIRAVIFGLGVSMIVLSVRLKRKADKREQETGL